MARGDLHDLFRRSLGDDAAPAAAAFWPEIDDPVGSLEDVEVVLDHDDRIAMVAEPVQHGQQHLDVVEMKARRRFVEDIERAPGVAFRELERELTRCASPPDSVVADWPSVM